MLLSNIKFQKFKSENNLVKFPAYQSINKPFYSKNLSIGGGRRRVRSTTSRMDRSHGINSILNAIFLLNQILIAPVSVDRTHRRYAMKQDK